MAKYQTCACHEGVATELFTTRRLSRGFPSLSSDGDPCARFVFQRIAPTLTETNNFQLRAPVLAPESAGASGRIHDAIVRGHAHFVSSTILRVRFQDRWSTSHFRTRVSASSSSVVHHFPGTKVQDVRPSRSISEEAFPRTTFLFVRSQRQRGSGAHIFRVGRGPQSPLASPFVPPSFSCLSYSLSFSKESKRQKKRICITKRICIMPSCDFLASFACARDQVRARIGLTMSPACWCCFRFRSSCYRT